jgi:hypothetical protein
MLSLYGNLLTTENCAMDSKDRLALSEARQNIFIPNRNDTIVMLSAERLMVDFTNFVVIRNFISYFEYTGK